MNATPDLLRLLSVPVFAWVAWRDVETRRVPDRAWVPLLALAARNALDGRVSPRAFIAWPVAPEQVPERYGRLLCDGSGVGGGLDLNALRMYLQWRGTTLEELRSYPSLHRDRRSLPAEPNSPGDGSITSGPVTNGGAPATVRTGGTVGRRPDRSRREDPWVRRRSSRTLRAPLTGRLPRSSAQASRPSSTGRPSGSFQESPFSCCSSSDFVSRSPTATCCSPRWVRSACAERHKTVAFRNCVRRT